MINGQREQPADAFPPKKTVIGLTGNIGTGKSTVLKWLQARGARTIDADAIAHEVLLPGGGAHAGVLAAFGADIRKPDGNVDRTKLGRIVFADPDQLATLEGIMHPAIFARIAAEVAAAAEPVIVIEAIKLLEAGMTSTLCDTVWVITSPVEQQIERLMATRNMPRAEAEARLAAQSSQEYKVSQADIVLDNSGTLAELEAQVEAAWRALFVPLAE